jgi:RNA polymerase sigma factor (sigma-70 family)
MDVEALYQRYGPMVMRRCRQLLRDEDQAMDASQDVFVQLLKNRKRLKADYPSSLLYRMATNLCLNRIRDQRRRGETRDEEVLLRIADWDDMEGRLEARSLLERLFGQQRDSTRTMAVLHYVDGMTLAEVADEVGLSVSGVRKRLRGLRESLRELEQS